MSAHTPGPWFHRTVKASTGADCEFIEASYGSGFNGKQYMSVSGCISKEDAALITAAPEIFEALEEINTKAGGLFAAMGHGLEISEQVWNEAFAALENGREAARKARGEE